MWCIERVISYMDANASGRVDQLGQNMGVWSRWGEGERARIRDFEWCADSPWRDAIKLYVILLNGCERDIIISVMIRSNRSRAKWRNGFVDVWIWAVTDWTLLNRRYSFAEAAFTKNSLKVDQFIPPHKWFIFLQGMISSGHKVATATDLVLFKIRNCNTFRILFFSSYLDDPTGFISPITSTPFFCL